jgi:hypothetical protein
MDALTVHHANIDRIKVSDQVPEDVAIQFETARNLYLYAWHEAAARQARQRRSM